MKKFPATFFFLLMSVLVQTIATVFPTVTDFLAFQPAAGILGWFGILTYQVAHGGWRHLIGNFTFGLPYMLFLESKLGRKRMEIFYILCGFSAALGQLMLVGPSGMIGSSGSVFGCAIGACMAFGETAEEHALALAMMFALLVPQIAMAPYGAINGVAVYGHVFGGLAGLALSNHFLNTRTLPK